MIVADSHSSRLHPECLAKCAELGFDLFLLPGGLTAHLQIMDQLFGAIKARFYKNLHSWALLDINCSLVRSCPGCGRHPGQRINPSRGAHIWGLSQ